MPELTPEKRKWLEEKARDMRISVIEELLEAGSGHPGGALGMADIFAAFYFFILKHDSTNPMWEDRDRLVLSNGHICPIYYAALAHSGYFPLEELKTLRKFGSRLQGHPHRQYLPLVENSSGPLGLGLSQAAGMAWADQGKKIYCILSDGELDEGNTWEAAMLAAKEKLHNLTAIIDRNKIQLEGKTETVMPLEPLAEKWEAFGWHVQEIDGHDFEEITDAVREAGGMPSKPSVIIANTVLGKGVSFMEGRHEWHGRVPDQEQAKAALDELRGMN